jgi:hypothetical protein
MSNPDTNSKQSKRQSFNRAPGKSIVEIAAAAAAAALKGSVARRKTATLDDLRANLQTAMLLELSTIPPYLSALYSIKEGKNMMAGEIIKSVVIEEMLHMVMVANLMNSIDAKPIVGRLPGQEFIPTYPTGLPGNVDPSLIVNLTSLTKSQIRAFIKIEHPGNEDREQHEGKFEKGGSEREFNTIGEFYEAILEDLKHFEKTAQADGKTIFTGTTKQVGPEHYYGAGGGIIPVHNLADAEAVIQEIVDQGEGVCGSIFSEPYDPNNDNYLWFGPDVEEYAHYFRFKEVMYGKFYQNSDSAHRDSPNKGLPTGENFDMNWDEIHIMNENPRMADYPQGSEVYTKMYDFNKTYKELLDNLNIACNGKPESLKEGIMVMWDLKYKATELMKIPGNNGLAAGPSFEYIE